MSQEDEKIELEIIEKNVKSILPEKYIMNFNFIDKNI